MNTVTIINADGCATRTRNVDRCNAETHIKARDQFASESEILLAYDADESLADRDPIAWKWNDPTEDAKFLFDESEVEEIESIDPSLIVRLKVVWGNEDTANKNNQKLREVVDAMQLLNGKIVDYLRAEGVPFDGNGIPCTGATGEEDTNTQFFRKKLHSPLFNLLCQITKTQVIAFSAYRARHNDSDDEIVESGEF